ncbi:hypothetical protein M432DRAFT_587108 [Thermoascus aurantiacus ATCC 26904]
MAHITSSSPPRLCDSSPSSSLQLPQNENPSSKQPDVYHSKKPHKMSRGGCFNCKARRVKCQETRPACTNCKNKDMICIYPSKAEQRLVRRHQLLPEQRQRFSLNGAGGYDYDYNCAPKEAMQRTLTPTLFTASDLRFFHHFLLVAYPHLPFGSDLAWVTVVPEYAHHCDYLMHAILSLGATHLSLIVPSGTEYTVAAVAHRGQALRGLSRMLAKDDHTREELDAMLATCYVLTFQARYMTDGLVDFATMIRGCALVTERLPDKHYANSSAFVMDEEQYILNTAAGLPEGPSLDTTLLDKSIQTLEMVSPLLENDAHRRFYGAIMDTYTALKSSSRRGYLKFVAVYAVWYTMGHREFLEFIAQENSVSQILFVHHVAFLKGDAVPAGDVLRAAVGREDLSGSSGGDAWLYPVAG